MDEPLSEASLHALDEFIMRLIILSVDKPELGAFDSEIGCLAASILATEPSPGHLYDRLDLSNDCLDLAATLLRHHGYDGFAALLTTMIEKNEIALKLNDPTLSLAA
jgi:hypothetical protein